MQTYQTEGRGQRFMDISVPEYAYMIGFLQCDGHLSGSADGKGRLSVELGAGDRSLLERFAELTPYPSSITERTRDTNFKSTSHSVTWTVNTLEARNAISELGMPYGAKGTTVEPPAVAFSKCDYFRGVLDANGSIGTTGTGLPFVSFGTASLAMARAIEAFLFSLTGKRKTVKPTRREGYYNLVLTKEDAQLVARTLYYPGALALERKAIASAVVAQWERPGPMKVAGPRYAWCDEADDMLRHCGTDAAAAIGVSIKAAAMRLSRVNKADNARSQRAA